MLFKPNMIVVITKGRLAGKKAVVVKNLESNMLLVAGIDRIPVSSEDYLPSWQKRRNEKFVTFIKKINIAHILATRYKADIGLTELDTESVTENATAKEALNTQANSILKDAYENSKAKWLFTTLSF